MSTLPTELIIKVLLALPSSPSSRFVSSTYQDRVSSLSNFSLASHAFDQIAEPHLYSTFWAKNKRQFDAFLQAVESKQNAHHVQRLVIDGSRGNIPQKRVSKAAKTLTSLKELSLYMLSLGKLTKLNGFRKLESLVLENVCHRYNSVFTLPSLRQLTIGHFCDIELSYMTAANAPQLSALASTRLTLLDGWDRSLSSTTPWNLDAVVLEWYREYRADQRYPNVLANIAFSQVTNLSHDSSVITGGLVHFRVRKFFKDAVNSGHLDALIEFIRFKSTSVHRLETLILSPDFDPNSQYLQSCVMLQLRARAKALQEECVAYGIDLIYEDSSDRRFNSDVPKAFVEKMQRLAQARRQAEASRQEEEENEH